TARAAAGPQGSWPTIKNGNRHCERSATGGERGNPIDKKNPPDAHALGGVPNMDDGQGTASGRLPAHQNTDVRSM
ncbi:MAG: hypothetical protein KAW61_09150, partial [candidate division Zixibacteria bacterium]|nr:hypothetical protein [candidate division Zixibacteria bacterium]